MKVLYEKKQLDFSNELKRDNTLVQARNLELKQITSSKVRDNAYISKKYQKYNLEIYKQDVINLGLKETWATKSNYRWQNVFQKIKIQQCKRLLQKTLFRLDR